MSLEAALASLTAAVEANTAALESIRASAGGGAADAAVAEAAERRGPGRPPNHTLEQVRIAVRKFADVTNPTDQEKRKEILLRLLASCGSKNLKELDPKKYGKFMEGLKKQQELLDAVGDDESIGEEEETEGDW